MSTQPPLRRSRRHATIIPISDWMSIGYSEDDAALMEELQQRMKAYRDDDDEGTIALSIWRERYVQHHDWMIPHWKELFKALRGRTSVTTVNIRRIHLPTSVLNIIFPSLKTMPNLTKLDLVQTRLVDKGLLMLSSFLKLNSSLHELFIDGYKMGLSVASALSDALNEHPTLEKLVLDNGGLEENPEILEKILEGCTRLTSLALMDNLGSVAVSVLSDFIRGNHPIRNIFLKHNRISDNDTVLLASALKTNTNLKQLDLRENDITEEGNKNTFRALYDPTSMDSIVESNHTCITYSRDITNQSIWDQLTPFEREVMKILNDGNLSTQQKIRRKVVLALCGVDGELFDLSHLNDLPLKLMPRVLELIQEHTSGRTNAVGICAAAPPGFICPRLAALLDADAPQLQNDALTRLFHTLRGWELPLLFENLRSPSKTTGKRKRMKTRR